MIKIKKFKPNEADNLHCLQACYIMVVYTLTGKWLNIEQAEKETGYVKGLPTWPFEAMLNFNIRGLKVLDMDSSDYTLFKKSAKDYLSSFIDDEKEIEDILKTTNEELETKRVIKMLSNDSIKNIDKSPTLEDIKELINDDYLIIVNVNSNLLELTEGYAGHFVILEQIFDKYVILQDPGGKGSPNRKVDIEIFIKSWAYFGEDTTEIMAIKKKN